MQIPDRVGQRFGNYRLTHLLGQGGFADVYLGEHVFLKSQVAIKVMKLPLAKDDLQSFIAQMHTIVSLVHPHIIRVLEFGIAGDRENGIPFLIMDYAPNGTLHQHYPQGSQLALTTILPYLKHIAQALYYAHRRRLIHGDVKPENMLLGPKNEILLSDFSIVLPSFTSSSQTTLVGTVAYMAPEQLKGKPQLASDQYALAIVVYKWLCGEVPFHGSLNEISAQHLFAAPPPLHLKVPGISSAVERVVLRALAKDPQRRFVNILTFVNALEQASKSVPERRDSRNFVLPSLPAPSNSNPPTISRITGRMPVTSSSIHSRPTLTTSSRQQPWVHSRPSSSEPTPLGIAEWDRYRTKRQFSRRALIIGLPALAVAGGAIIAWLVSESESSKTNASSAAKVAKNPTVTPSSLAATIFTYRGHSDGVTDVAWSPDGKRIISGSNDQTVQVWDVATGTRLLRRSSSGGTSVLSWSPDSTRIASASGGASVSGGPAGDKTVQVWNASTGQSIFTYRGHSGGVTDVAWSPKGRQIASSSVDYTVQVWDATSGENNLIYRTYSWYVLTIAWSPDGIHIASGSPDGTVQMWNVTTGKTLRVYTGHTDGVESVVWSPDGTRIASASDDYTVRVWDIATGNTLHTYRGHSSYVRTVAWSPDGTCIVSGSADKTAHVWDAATGRTIFTYYGHSDEVTAVAWSPDSTRIASSSLDKTVRVWKAAKCS